MHLITSVGVVLAAIGPARALSHENFTPVSGSTTMTTSAPIFNLNRTALYLTPDTDTTAASDFKVSYNEDQKVPIDELPPCYYECMVENCCNMMIGGPGDVRDLTINEFCETKWFYVENWIFDRLQDCVGEKCRGCRPQCGEESNHWMKRVCGRGPG
ncbi:hypothetical protein DL762_003700 [Monosporascus cannonballus]|uniref:Uncharacterized protein n=1 Tax=Monosporascus cannonballus TaxID=155416 RepID=A0ABY0HCZ2_9PEZI|nr:hypothetical protein DL762_003700 [Monosporascus cannonballus]